MVDVLNELGLTTTQQITARSEDKCRPLMMLIMMMMIVEIDYLVLIYIDRKIRTLHLVSLAL
jgi:hypothetical protein